jgi:Lar family restriction alleviation protein
MSEHHHTSAATIAPLLPCPFCGGQASLCDTGVTWLMCDDCQAEGPVAEAEREAVEKWNGRSGGAAQAPLSEAERHAIAHARYQVEHASPDNPDCHFDYELVLNLLHVIERSAQPPAAPVERSAPAAPTGDTRSGERPPASAAMGHSAGADTRCSAGTDAAVEELAEFLCDEYEGEIGSFCSFNIETKDRWRDLVRAMLARIPAQPQTPKEPELLERASNAIGALLQWTSNWTVPFEGEDEWLGDKDVALRVRDEIGSVLSRPHGATPSVPAASAPAQRHRE